MSPDSKSDMNQTRCFSGHKNNLLVYKVESSLKTNPPDSTRIVAVEKQSTAEVEVQVWSTAEGLACLRVHKVLYGTMICFLKMDIHVFTGVLQIMEIGDVQRKYITDHPENYKLLTTLDEGLF